MHLSALTTQSSKFTATAVVMAGAVTVVEATTMDGVEAIIMVITIGETSLPLMLNYSGRGQHQQETWRAEVAAGCCDQRKSRPKAASPRIIQHQWQ
jgi:hypothetical protein